MPNATCYMLLVDDKPLWATTSERTALEFADPYVATSKSVRIRANWNDRPVAEWKYDPSSGTWHDELRDGETLEPSLH